MYELSVQLLANGGISMVVLDAPGRHISGLGNELTCQATSLTAHGNVTNQLDSSRI